MIEINNKKGFFLACCS